MAVFNPYHNPTMETRTYTVYKFEELSEKAQEKAIENLYDINSDYDWWHSCYDQFNEELGEIGIKCETFYFELDRANSIYMEKPFIVDVQKFLKFAGVDMRKKLYKELLDCGIAIETKHVGGGTAYNKIYEDEKLDDALQGLLSDFLSSLQSEYDFITSPEVIKETIINNEYDFLEDGTLS